MCNLFKKYYYSYLYNAITYLEKKLVSNGDLPAALAYLQFI